MGSSIIIYSPFAKFLKFAWGETSTSNDYKNPEIWDDFDKVVEKMFDTVEAVCVFGRNNILYYYYLDGKKSPAEVYEGRRNWKEGANCVDLSKYIKYCLVNGADYFGVTSEHGFNKIDDNVCCILEVRETLNKSPSQGIIEARNNEGGA